LPKINLRRFAPGVAVSRTAHAFFARLAVAAGANFLTALRASKFAPAWQRRQTGNQLVDWFATDMASSEQMIGRLMRGIHELIDPLRQAINLVCPLFRVPSTGGQEFIDDAIEIEFHKVRE
jgi:hypothetical protein